MLISSITEGTRAALCGNKANEKGQAHAKTSRNGVTLLAEDIMQCLNVVSATSYIHRIS